MQDGKIQLNKKYIAAQTDANIEPVYITKLYSFYFTNYRLLGTREEFYLPTHNVLIATNKVHIIRTIHHIALILKHLFSSILQTVACVPV